MTDWPAFPGNSVCKDIAATMRTALVIASCRMCLAVPRRRICHQPEEEACAAHDIRGFRKPAREERYCEMREVRMSSRLLFVL